MTGSCPSDNAIAAHCAGAREAESGFLVHLDDCISCQTVVAALLHSIAAPKDQHAPPNTLRPQTLEASAVVADRYEILQLLGWGGMGEVYLAKDRQLNEFVALKTLSILKADAPELAIRLRGEAQLARRVTHPNVVRIFDFGTHRQKERTIETVLPFLTMELLDGQTVGNRVRTKGPFSFAEGIPIAIDMLRGLGAVHAAGIIHRDLKPDNVFLTTSASQNVHRTVITDFGLARSSTLEVSRHSQTGTIVGTFAYLSPEQLEGKPATQASDIYAFGIVLHEILTGQVPGSQPDVYRSSLVNGASHALPRLPRGLTRIIEKCMRRDPDFRYSNTEAVAHDLADVLAERTDLKSGPLLQSKPKAAFKTIALMAPLAAILAVVGFSQFGQMERERTTKNTSQRVLDNEPIVAPMTIATNNSVNVVVDEFAHVSTKKVLPSVIDIRRKPRLPKQQSHPMVSEVDDKIRDSQDQAAAPVSPSPSPILNGHSNRHPDDVVDPFASFHK